MRVRDSLAVLFGAVLLANAAAAATWTVRTILWFDLPARYPQCTAPCSAWWQAFAVHDITVGHVAALRVGTPPEPERRARLSPLAEARRYQALLENDPSIETRTDVARELGVSKARVTQVLGLLKLTPEVQNTLLALRDQKPLRFFSERRLRPLTRISHPKRQVRAFRRMLAAARQ